MSNHPPGDRSTKRDLGPLAGVGVAALMIGCCAAPALIAGGVAAGALGAVGAWLANPWLIAAGVAVAALVVVQVTRRINRTGCAHDNCCTPPRDASEADRREGR